jgi:type IV pilus assembly protein PilX
MKHTLVKKQRQSGIALIFVLLILVVVSLLGVGGAQLALMGERGARNERDTQIARQYAEEALQDAEFDMRGLGNSQRRALFDSESNFIENCGTTGVTQGMCAENIAGKPIWLLVDFSDQTSPSQFTKLGQQTGRKLASTGNGIQPALEPRYIVEVIPDSTVGTVRGVKEKKKILHRVTAMGFGPRKDIQTVLQSVFRKEVL